MTTLPHARDNQTAAAALDYASRGWIVLPVHHLVDGICTCPKGRCCPSPAKHPVGAWKGKGSKDPKEVERWCKDHPAANVGIVTGSASGIFVLDVDGESGRESLRTLEAKHGVLPDTWTVTTGSSGTHFYFLWPEGRRITLSAGKLGEGLDIRGEGGFVVAPPSLHRSGRRYILNESAIPPVEAPAWLLDRIEEPAPAPADGNANGGARIPKGKRHDHLVSLAGTMQRRGMTLSAIEAALLRENEMKCDPPMPESDVREIAADISRRYIAQGTPTAEAGGLKLKRGSEVVVREQRWLVKDFLPDDTLVIVAGETGLGKTTASLSWAADVTRGRVPVIGIMREARNVLVLTNEDSESRVVRQFLAHGGDLNRLYIEDDEAEYPWGLGDLASLEARIAELQPALVIIDSLTTHKPDGVKLNSSDDIPKSLVRLRKMATAHHCTIVVIHHDNKTRTTDPLEKIANSKSIINTARHNLLVAKDPERPEDPTARVVVVVNTNLTAMGRANYRFQLEEVQTEVTACWQGLTCVREENVLQLQSGEERSSQGDAETFLLEALRDERVDCVELKRMAKDGYGIEEWTLHRAATKLRVVREPSGFGSKRKVFWRLPRSIDDTIDNTHAQSVIDGEQPIETPKFNAGSIIDDNKSGSVIDGVIDCNKDRKAQVIPMPYSTYKTPRGYQD